MLTFLEHAKSQSEGYHPIQLVFGPKPMFDVKQFKEDFNSAHVDALDKHLQKHYHQFDGEDKHNIRKYTDISSHVNKHLYDHHGLGPGRHEQYIKSFDKTLHKHQTPHDIHVYTGVHPEHHLAKIGHKQGANEDNHIKVVHHGYTSATIHHGVAKSFARATNEVSTDNEQHHHEEHHRHVIKIHVPKGHPGAYVEHHTMNPYEHEFILPRGTKLHVHPNPETVTKRTRTKSESGKLYTSAVHYHTWSAKIAHD